MHWNVQLFFFSFFKLPQFIVSDKQALFAHEEMIQIGKKKITEKEDLVTKTNPTACRGESVYSSNASSSEAFRYARPAVGPPYIFS